MNTSISQLLYLVSNSTMLPKSYTSSDSGPKSPLTKTWIPSPNFVSCLGLMHQIMMSCLQQICQKLKLQNFMC